MHLNAKTTALERLDRVCGVAQRWANCLETLSYGVTGAPRAARRKILHSCAFELRGMTT